MKEFEAVINDLVLKSDHGITPVDYKRRSLNIIANRNDGIKQDIIIDDSQSNLKYHDILDIPVFTKTKGKMNIGKLETDQTENKKNTSQH